MCAGSDTGFGLAGGQIDRYGRLMPVNSPWDCLLVSIPTIIRFQIDPMRMTAAGIV
jgi:hypothetical protein